MTAQEGLDDDAIAAAFAAGPSDVGLRLAYERWGGLVLALALRAMDRADAEDVVQQTFVSAGPSDVGLRLAYERWGGLVLALALRAMDRADAEDVVQQTFVSAWRSRDRYDADAGPLGAWIVRIARRRIADHFRVASVTRERAVDPTDALDRAERAHPTDVPDVVAGSILVEETLAGMDEPQRTIVRLAVLEDLPASVIADRLELPVGTVKSHLSRTLRRLRDRWEGTHAAHLA